ncbi:MAG: ATP-binding protein [Deltaproteobacteria bacterium]|nr:ATP-binding protein [Deltaproteobacteria bacterium]
MPRTFNTTGPNIEALHYTLPPLGRIPADVFDFVKAGNYFVLHAPRQSGKTTSMQAFARALRGTGQYAAVYATLEEARATVAIDPALRQVVDAISRASRAYLPPEEHAPKADEFVGEASMLSAFLTAWSRQVTRPLVLILDEIDALPAEPLMAVLGQLRAGYLTRGDTPFPHSVCLFGMRNIRDYKAASGGSPRIGTASPFNVSKRAITVAYFTAKEIGDLYGQHTAETGQRFTEAALDRVWQLSRGQPFLVNALADWVISRLHWTGPVDVAQIDAAKEQLILDRVTHIDSLAARLCEDRVRRVIEPMLAGDSGERDDSDFADVEYCRDLGLVATIDGNLAVANEIYREVIPRELAAHPQSKIHGLLPSWRRPDGSLDWPSLMAQFVEFWRENGEWMLKRAHWPEAAHQIVFMAFLQKVVNGGGSIDREYGLGRKRLDLLLCWSQGPAPQWIAIELKLWRQGKKDPLAEGLLQIDEYLQRMALGEGVLVIFDLRAEALPWGERGSKTAEVTASGRGVEVWRL